MPSNDRTPTLCRGNKRATYTSLAYRGLKLHRIMENAVASSSSNHVGSAAVFRQRPGTADRSKLEESDDRKKRNGPVRTPKRTGTGSLPGIGWGAVRESHVKEAFRRFGDHCARNQVSATDQVWWSSLQVVFDGIDTNPPYRLPGHDQPILPRSSRLPTKEIPTPPSALSAVLQYTSNTGSRSGRGIETGAERTSALPPEYTCA